MVRGGWCVVRGNFRARDRPRTTHYAPWLTQPQPALLTDIRSRAAYSEGAGIYRIVPKAVAVPQGVEKLQELVRWAAATGRALVPRGAGSGMAGGSVGHDIVVDLSQGFRWIAPDWPGRSLWAGASVTWADVTAAARPFGLRLPPDPSSGAFATSGGMIATNAAGPRSLRYGSVRRWVEAVEIVDARGDIRRVARGAGWGMRDAFALAQDKRRLIATRFPRTRKNSSGYALDAFAESGDELDLLVGSEGTLAFVTQVQWRLEPILPDVAGVALGFGELEALGDAVPYLLALNPSAVELLDRTILSFVEEAGVTLPAGLACLLLVEFERETAAAARGVVGDAVRGLKHLTAHVETAVDRAGLERLWRVRTLASPALARLSETRRSLQVIEDGCVPIARLGEYVAGVRAAADRLGIPVVLFGHAGDGHVHVNTLPDVTRAGAEVVAEFRRVKRAYDPLEILNPGVILPAADWAPLADVKVGAGAAPIPDDIAARLREVERTATWLTPKTTLAGT